MRGFTAGTKLRRVLNEGGLTAHPDGKGSFHPHPARTNRLDHRQLQSLLFTCGAVHLRHATDAVRKLALSGYRGEMAGQGDPRDTYPRNADCPCGSTRKAKKCCYSTGRWWKPPAHIWPPAPRTGYAQPGCYANLLTDCGGGLSGEHYVSRLLLRGPAKAKSVSIANAAWQKERRKYKSVGIDRLKAKILCKRHNESLSDLDAEAGNLANALAGFGAWMDLPARSPKLTVCSGENLERWLLKSLIGYFLVEGPIKHPGKKLRPQCVDLLYGLAPWPPGWGFWYRHAEGHAVHKQDTLTQHIIWDPTNDEAAIFEFCLRGFFFALVMCGIDNWDKFGIYRPNAIVLDDNGTWNLISVTWQDPSNLFMVMMTNGGTYQGPPPVWPDWMKEQH